MLVVFKNLKQSKKSDHKLTLTKLKVLLVCVLILYSFSTFAIDSDQWQIQKLQIDDGLPDSTVFSLQQDQSGFMWFGTTNGLARYDGYSFKIFKHDGSNENTLSNNNAGNIFIDSKNLLWIGTFGGGVNTLDLNTGKLIRYPYSNSKLDQLISENVQTFYEDIHSNIWIGTPAGLYKKNEDELIRYSHKKDDENSLIHSRVWDITGNNKNDIWIGTSDGLSHLNSKTGEFLNYKLPKELVVNISSNQFRKLYLTDKILWIGSSTGLYSFDLTTKTFKENNTDHKIKINDIFLIDNNHYLIASMDGLHLFDIKKQSFVNNKTGQYWHYLNHIDVRRIFKDKSGLLWLATRDQGVIKIDQMGGLFQHHNKYQPIDQITEKNKQVWALESDSKGNLYFGTSGALYKKSSDNKTQEIVIDNSKQIPGIIRDIKVIKNQGVWIASSEGLFYLSKGQKTAQIITKPFDLAKIAPTDIFSVEVTNSGELWMSLYNIGILRWDPKTSQANLIKNHSGITLTDSNIGHIYQDSDKNIWIASNIIGLLKYNNQTEKMILFSHDFNRADSISSNRIKDIFQDTSGRLWIATARGLNLLNKETNSFKHYTKDDGLLDNSINAILEDSNKNLWIGYKFGISKFIPGRDEISNYSLNKGIRNDGMIPRAVNIDQNDILYFGSANGFFTFNPQDIKKDTQFIPELKLTDVRINNKVIPFEKLASNIKTFNLDHNDKLISFDFAALEFKSPEQVHYQYRIMGLHSAWNDVSWTRHIELNNLNPGQYSLEIKASNSDDRWSEQILPLKVNIHPIWYNLGWVRIIFAILGICLGLLFHHFRTMRIRNQNIILENEVKNRTSELLLLNKQLKRASHTDFLTGLYNRMGFLKKFKKRQKKSKKYCIVVTDLDNFKNINDIYSHSAGDQVLIEIAQIMKNNIDKEDMIARWGGEEFIIYLENKNASQAYEKVEKIRREIEKAIINYKGLEITITSTFGICQMQPDMGLNECINAADESLYIGKSQNRNTTIVSEGQ
jgi:diguanylate cyclase (GGDEF)-like protein